MNLEYIKSEIYNLGFSTANDVEESIVIQAINRAIGTIASTVRPITSKHTISRYKLKNSLSDGTETKHFSGEPITYNGNGVSYYFECDGTGTAKVDSDDGTIDVELSADKEFKAYKGFCSGNVTITFSGEYSYNIRNVAVYTEKTSGKLRDIPSPDNSNFYDFKEIAKEKGEVFLAFGDKYKKGNNFSSFTTVTDFDVIDRHILRLNNDDGNEYTIFYIKQYTPITAETPIDTELELDPDLHILVPLLAAFYVWQDDEERKADKYYNDYETKRNDIMAKERRVVAYVRGDDYAD